VQETTKAGITATLRPTSSVPQNAARGLAEVSANSSMDTYEEPQIPVTSLKAIDEVDA
jgi:hypothetical protein